MTINEMAEATLEFSLEALELTCERFRNGDVERDNQRMPPATSELVPQLRMIDAGFRVQQREPLPPGPPGYRQLPTGEIVVPIGAPVPDGYETCGDISVDFGHGSIDLRGMTKAEKEEVYRQGGLPPLKKIEGARPLPKLQRMA